MSLWPRGRSSFLLELNIACHLDGIHFDGMLIIIMAMGPRGRSSFLDEEKVLQLNITCHLESKLNGIYFDRMPKIIMPLSLY